MITDVPCSGLGIIRKKPDIRYKDPKALEGLPQVQRGILEGFHAPVEPAEHLHSPELGQAQLLKPGFQL